MFKLQKGQLNGYAAEGAQWGVKGHQWRVNGGVLEVVS